jgi:hypothetical protein
MDGRIGTLKLVMLWYCMYAPATNRRSVQMLDRNRSHDEVRAELGELYPNAVAGGLLVVG